ncbi:hypothetical protein NPX13_g6028 [Xylaria arbuscula]|uniref:Uncharacterized protein n=1 Tax=Xylaria arbuscula TaxID=114810 RepID=A0A9W8NDN9_9PEZI|nr:hypothetical protein NPX13_g6028 [Xylaria arbuscula]
MFTPTESNPFYMPSLSADLMLKSGNKFIMLSPNLPLHENLISSILQTPWRLTTSSVMNSSEKRDQMDKLLSDELGVMYINVPNFYEAFWGGIPQLEMASEDIFQKCTQGIQPLFQEGWTAWPEDAKQKKVLAWLANIVERFLQWAEEYR